MVKPYLGIWVDHREAYLVWASEDGEVEIQHADSHYPEQGHRAHQAIAAAAGAFGGVPPHADLGHRQRREARRFHERLFKAIRHAQSVYIFGPGLAKKELHRRLREHKGFDGRVRAVQSAERMSEARMAAHVREFFKLPYPPSRMAS